MQSKTEKRKKIYATVSIILALIFFGILTWVIGNGISSVASSPEEFVAYIRSFGWAGALVMLGFQVLQVFIALIPGEVVEIAAGFAFGPIGGTLLCLFGISLASIIIFLLVKRWGRPLVEIFVSAEKLDQLRFLNDETKIVPLLFLLYFIPGTPKDVLNYFVGLTKLRLGQFLGISLTARIPSIITSTVGGSFVSSGDYIGAAIVFTVTALVSAAGIVTYNHIIKKRALKKQ